MCFLFCFFFADIICNLLAIDSSHCSVMYRPSMPNRWLVNVCFCCWIVKLYVKSLVCCPLDSIYLTGGYFWGEGCFRLRWWRNSISELNRKMLALDPKCVRNTFLSVFLLLSFTVCSALHEYRLSDPRLLLPYPLQSTTVQYNISAAGGCFVWHSTRPHVISVRGSTDSMFAFFCFVYF